MHYNHIFGPVPSRRLGVSLGIDLVTHKICSMDCVYCECGKTTLLTLERKEYVKFKDVVKELEHYWAHEKDPDYITFSGSGEPTLNTCLSQVIDYIKETKPHIKVAVLTNSSLISDPKVRAALLKVDLVVPSLDAVSQKAFARINRPDKALDISEIIKGMEIFAKNYNGKIWLEILVLPGFNNEDSDLALLKDAIKRINPDQVQINTLDRPGTLSNIRPASRLELDAVVKRLDFHNTQIIAKVDVAIKAQTQREDIKVAIVETIHRRPCTKEDLLKILDIEKQVMDAAIDILEKEQKIIGTPQERGIFYQTIKE